ncbi:MAG: hypothetical protein XD98_0336 [Microgenomates bacterium 39_6]|nr:MAG: hypothetical protein XD98_0336 [Microgenomates bacterium 39_6]
MKTILKIYAWGVTFLLGAIFINFFSGWLGFLSWYNFLGTGELNLRDGLWLFIGYPFLLGFLGYVLNSKNKKRKISSCFHGKKP